MGAGPTDLHILWSTGSQTPNSKLQVVIKYSFNQKNSIKLLVRRRPIGRQRIRQPLDQRGMLISEKNAFKKSFCDSCPAITDNTNSFKLVFRKLNCRPKGVVACSLKSPVACVFCSHNSFKTFSAYSTFSKNLTSTTGRLGVVILGRCSHSVTTQKCLCSMCFTGLNFLKASLIGQTQSYYQMNHSIHQQRTNENQFGAFEVYLIYRFLSIYLQN